MRRSPVFIAIFCLVFACKNRDCSKRVGDVPLHVSNAPACTAGHEYAKQVVIRIESGDDYAQFGLEPRMVALNTLAGKQATVKVAHCPKNANCPNPTWGWSHSTIIGGGDDGLSLELPKFEVMCDDGTIAKN